jgi:hypothetical protein
MSGMLTHSAANIVRQLLTNLGETTAPADNANWSGFYSFEPEERDRVVTVFDTAGILRGRTHVDGETQVHYGLQVRIRSEEYGTGYTKAEEIAVALDTQTHLSTVVIGSTTYTVYAFTRLGTVLAIGREAPNSKRSIFTINGLASITQV